MVILETLQSHSKSLILYLLSMGFNILLFLTIKDSNRLTQHTIIIFRLKHCKKFFPVSLQVNIFPFSHWILVEDPVWKKSQIPCVVATLYQVMNSDEGHTHDVPLFCSALSGRCITFSVRCYDEQGNN